MLIPPAHSTAHCLQSPKDAAYHKGLTPGKAAITVNNYANNGVAKFTSLKIGEGKGRGGKANQSGAKTGANLGPVWAAGKSREAVRGGKGREVQYRGQSRANTGARLGPVRAGKGREGSGSPIPGPV